MEKSFNKYYVKRNYATGEVLTQNDKPILGDIAKSDCRLSQRNADILNKTWERSGIYYSEVQTNDSNKTSNNDKIRQALITEANSLGISFRDNIGNDKLQERINEFKNKN